MRDLFCRYCGADTIDVVVRTEHVPDRFSEQCYSTRCTSCQSFGPRIQEPDGNVVKATKQSAEAHADYDKWFNERD